MNDDSFTPDEQALIDQLRAARKPRMKPEVAAAIREQMLAEFRTMPQQPLPAPRRFPLRIILAAAAVVVLIFLALLSQRPGAIDSTPAVPPTSIALAASETPTLTAVPSATTALVLTSPPPTIEATITPTPEILVVIEGKVSAIGDNSLTVYDFDIPIEPEHPIRNLIEVGDFVHVEGTYAADGAFVAAVIGNLSETTVVSGSTASVGVEGPVESIDDNILTVSSIPVQLDPDDPLLKTLRVGDFVSVEGNFQGSADTIVLVVVTITVRTDVNEIEGDCWYHEAMGMGHWHCDGMGMGAMGMSEEAMGMGMGMGNDEDEDD